MNLALKQLPAILFGGLIGAFVGFLISLIITPDLFPEIEKVVGIKGLYIIFGTILGVAFSIIKLVIKSSRAEDSEFAHNVTQINGMGSFLIGKTDISEDESYITTEWFTILWIPIFPVCRYRVIEHKHGRLAKCVNYTILEKYTPTTKSVIKVYVVTIVIISIMPSISWYLFS